MPLFFEARRLRYEIHKLCDKRWQIAAVIGDGREEHGRRWGRTAFEEVERSVLDQANALLAGEVRAVRVLRERLREDGFSTMAEIFFREATGPKPEAPVTVNRYDGAVPLCATAPDLSTRGACQAIGVLLRGYLDRHFITPLELLHHYPYIRKLNDNYSLIQGAVHQAATAQAKASGEDVKTRAATLHAILEAAEKRARDAMAEKRLPNFADGDFQMFARRMAARYDGEQVRFYTLVAIARHFQGAQSFEARLLFALDLVATELPAGFAELLDELAAACLDSSQLVMDLLGHQPNLAAALVALADLARGEGAGPAGPSAGKLRERIAAGALPLCADSLWERIVRELARGRPLSRTDDKQEWNLIMKTSDRLLAVCPEDLKATISGHFKERLRRLRAASALRD